MGKEMRTPKLSETLTALGKNVRTPLYLARRSRFFGKDTIQFSTKPGQSALFENAHTDQKLRLSNIEAEVFGAVKAYNGIIPALMTSGQRAVVLARMASEITGKYRSGKKLYSSDEQRVMDLLLYMRENLNKCTLKDLIGQYGDVSEKRVLEKLTIALKVAISEQSDPDLIHLALSNLQLLLDKINKESDGIDAGRYKQFLPNVVCALSWLLIEVGPSKFEVDINQQISPETRNYYARINREMMKTRKSIFEVLECLFSREDFGSLRPYIRSEFIQPLRACCDDKYAYSSARVSLATALYDTLNELKFTAKKEEAAVKDLISRIYRNKPQRFGTSGVRSRLGIDITTREVIITAESLAHYLKEVAKLNPSEKVMVIAYDTRKDGDKIAKICAAVFLRHGFKVHLFRHPLPTGAALNYALYTKEVGQENLAGIINCTPSHNPLPWVGIRFSGADGGPAGSSITGIVNKFMNERILLDEYDKGIEEMAWDSFRTNGGIRKYFEGYRTQGMFEVVAADNEVEEGNIARAEIAKPHEAYVNFARDLVKMVFGPKIFEKIAEYYGNKEKPVYVVWDSLKGAGAGYWGILTKIGVPRTRIVTMHEEGNKRDPNLLEVDGTRIPSNPEEKRFLELAGTFTKAKAIAAEKGAQVTFCAQDTDSDRGVVGSVNSDGEAEYISANRLFSALATAIIQLDNTRDKKVIVTKSDPSTLQIDYNIQRMLEDPAYRDRIIVPGKLKLAGYEVEGNPAFYAASFFRMRWNPEIDMISKGLVEYTTPVGFKELTAVMLNGLDPRASAILGNGQSVQITMGFEESAGFGIGIEAGKTDEAGQPVIDPITKKPEMERRFIPDKDGVVGSILCIALQAWTGKQIHEIVKEQEDKFKLHSKRMDIFASTQVKMKIINQLLEEAHAGRLTRIADIELSSIEPEPILGGVYYDQFRFIYRRDGQESVPLEKREFVSFMMRMSGTEPLVRVYVESTNAEIKNEILSYVQGELTRITIGEINRAKSLRAIVDVISVTPLVRKGEDVPDEDGNPFVANYEILQSAVKARLEKAANEPDFIDKDRTAEEVVSEFVGPMVDREDIFDAAVKVKYAGPVSARTIAEKLKEFFGGLKDAAAAPIEAKIVKEESAKPLPDDIKRIMAERITEVLAASPDPKFAELCLLDMELKHLVGSTKERLLAQIDLIKNLFMAHEQKVEGENSPRYLVHSENISAPDATEIMIVHPEGPNLLGDWGSFLGSKIIINGKVFPLSIKTNWSVDQGKNTVLIFEVTDVNGQKLDDKTFEEVKRQLRNRA